MEPSLTDYRAEYQDRLLELLWRQWTALGVAGQGKSWTRTPLDPEALLLISCTIARRDPRLFDAMLDWLQVNGRYVNVHRLQRMLTTLPFAGAAAFAAVAGAIGTTNQTTKWERSSKRLLAPKAPAGERLFVMADGQPLPVVREPDPRFLAHGFLRDQYQPRHVATLFRPETTANLLLRLRAFLGVNARCEILAYLLVNRRGSPRAMAQACGYYPATVTKALAEMGDSGYVASRVEGRHRHYTLIPEAWRPLLMGKESAPNWITWPTLFCALEHVWIFLMAPERAGQSPLAQASALRRLLQRDALAGLARSGLPVAFGGGQQHAGESLLPFFVGQLREVLDGMHRLG
jgi:hypothetical protein